MCQFISTCFILIFISQLTNYVQVSAVNRTFIIDGKTAKQLPIQTHTYYAIQNQKTERFLIWYGKNETVPEDLDQSQSRFWHIFEDQGNGWYKMYHHFGAHVVRLARSHDAGYYQLFNRDCFRGEHPNSDNTVDNQFVMRCFAKDGADLMEFNWKFFKKDNQETIPDEIPDETETGLSHSIPTTEYHYGYRAVFPVITTAIILAVIFYIVQRRQQLFNRNMAQVFYSQDNANFVNQQPVFPQPPQPPPPAPLNHNNNQNPNPWKMNFSLA